MKITRSFFGTVCVAFLTMVLSDVPIICPDERPQDPASFVTSVSGPGFSLQGQSTQPESSRDHTCSCPCHYQFRAEQGLSVSAAPFPDASVETPSLLVLHAPIRSLDRPPQNRA